MNMTTLINDIKLSEGLNTIALPWNKPVEMIIKEAIQISIHTYSRFKPCIKFGYEYMDNLRPIAENNNSIYFLPEFLTSSPVKKAYGELASTGTYKNGDVSSANLFTVGSPFIGFGSYYPQDIIDATLTGATINKYTGLTTRVPTTEWLGFNKIRLFDFPRNSLIKFTVECEHDENCETIPDTCIESFMRLAVLDVRRTLYNNLINMTNVGSALKEYRIQIDRWSSASEQRDALVDKWSSTFYIDDLNLIQFF